MGDRREVPARWTGSQPRKYPSRGRSPGRGTSRHCDHCGLDAPESDDDPCIENLPGAMNACCGHGDVEIAYVQFSPTHRIAGQEALDWIQAVKDEQARRLSGELDRG